MTLLVFLMFVGFAGTEFSAWLWREERTDATLSGLERAVAAVTTAAALWLALSWFLALIHQLRAGTLVGGAAALALAAMVWRLRRGRAAAQVRSPFAFDVLTAALVPLVFWTAFLMWRGHVTPPATPDALTYHLPRAALFAKAGGYQTFDYPDARINLGAANYELLLADLLVFEHEDTDTEWLSTSFYLFFLLIAAALARRWWGAGRQVLLAVLLTAAVPVLLLQGAAYKNDLMAACFFLAALLWLGRWVRHRERASAILLILSLAAGFGTKPQGVILAAFAIPVFFFGDFRAPKEERLGLGRLLPLAGIAVLATFLLGGFHLLASLADATGLKKTRSGASSSAAVAGAASQYGEWSYLWQAPIMMFVAPFSPSDDEVIVPWSGDGWLWQRYDVHGSSFGLTVSLLAMLLPITLVRYRRDPDSESMVERCAVTAAALLAAAAVLPTNFPPHGYIAGYPRYLLFLAPIIICWTAVPILRELQRGAHQHRVVASALIVAASGIFIITANRYAVRDKWVPLGAVRWAAARPGTRWIPSMPLRAASVVDRLAGPTDRVDVHGGYDTWIYPAFGLHLSRNLHFISSVQEIRPDAQWVIVDRAFTAIWQHPQFTDMKDWRMYLGRGTPTVGDLVVLRPLLHDPRFELVFLSEQQAQAVFRRR